MAQAIEFVRYYVVNFFVLGKKETFLRRNEDPKKSTIRGHYHWSKSFSGGKRCSQTLVLIENHGGSLPTFPNCKSQTNQDLFDLNECWWISVKSRWRICQKTIKSVWIYDDLFESNLGLFCFILNDSKGLRLTPRVYFNFFVSSVLWFIPFISNKRPYTRSWAFYVSSRMRCALDWIYTLLLWERHCQWEH